MSTAILAVREPFRAENRGAAAPIFWPERRVSRSLRRETERWGAAAPPFSYPHGVDRRFRFPDLAAIHIPNARDPVNALPSAWERRHANRRSRDSRNRVRLSHGGGESESAKVDDARRRCRKERLTASTCRVLRRRRSSGNRRSTCRHPWVGRCACRGPRACRPSNPSRHRSYDPTAIRRPCRGGSR